MTEETNGKMPVHLEGYYWVCPQVYIISDHPNAKNLKKENPQIPCLPLAELEEMGRKLEEQMENERCQKKN